MDFKLPSLNKVFVAGNLLDNPESRVTSNGARVTNFKVACNKRFRDSQGRMKDKTCYISVVTWNKLAETCNNVLKKGDGVFIDGELQNRQTSSDLEVLANKVEFLTKRNYSTKSEEQDE